jgi:carbonic anhydrase
MTKEIARLLEGNQEFRKKFFNKKNALFKLLVEQGQNPKVMVVACSDSRVDPAMIFNCLPGQLFVIRNVASLIPPCEENNSAHGTSAALEFGACFLNVEHIIILGHTQCGGIRALMEHAHTVLHPNPHSFIAQWMSIARPAYNRVMQEHHNALFEEKLALCERYAVVNSLHNLSSFPWIQERVTKQALHIHAWHFNLATGFIHRYDTKTDTWSV